MEAQRSEFKNVIRVADNNPQPHCRKGQYFSSSRNACVTCSRCDLFSVKVADCNATTDTVCVKCLSDTGDARVKFKDPVCTFCKPCGPGEYVKRHCDPRRKKKTKCKACEQGSFKVMKSFSTHCVPCTDCGNMKIKTECTNTTDTECGQCKPGHFLDKSRNICHRCRSCMPNEKTIEECQQRHNGKHCGGIYLRSISHENSFAGEETVKSLNKKAKKKNTNKMKKKNKEKKNSDLYKTSSA
ncbi:Tumor necrosis factor receptor super member 11B [Bulinus truncatus]|nr:Tumor necrosis factor receptor super member 11B [Bulinus truncatus]